MILYDPFEVSARAEHLASPGQHDPFYCTIGCQSRKMLGEGGDHFKVKGVIDLGSIESHFNNLTMWDNLNQFTHGVSRMTLFRLANPGHEHQECTKYNIY